MTQPPEQPQPWGPQEPQEQPPTPPWAQPDQQQQAGPWQQPQPGEQPQPAGQPWQQASQPDQQQPWQQSYQQPPSPGGTQQWQQTPQWQGGSTEYAPGLAGPPGGPAPANPAARRRMLIIIGVIVALVVGIIATTLVLQNQARQRAEEEESRAAAARVGSAAAAVQGFFDAIAAGDSAAALGYVEPDGIGTDMVTDEVLATSAEIAPITDIVVTPPAEVPEYSSSADVAVTYMLGDTEVSQTYLVQDTDGDNTWTLAGGLVEAWAGELPEGIDITLNGAPLTSTEFGLLPGAYRLGTTTTYYALAGETDFVVTDVYSASVPYIELTLNDDGVAAFREAVTSAVEKCVASKKLETGCGLAIPATLSDGTKLDDGTLDRELSDDARSELESMEPTISFSDPTVAEGSYIGVVDVTADCTKGDQTGSCEILFAPSLESPSVVMTDPELPVSWD